MAKNEEKPTVTASAGKDVLGKFAKGNTYSQGNLRKGITSKVKLLKAAFVEEITVDEIKAIARKLVTMAKAGDVTAAKEVFDRCFGKALQTHEIDVDVRTYTQEECDNIRKMLAVRFVDAKPKKAS